MLDSLIQCVNIFYLLQNYDDPLEEHQQNVARIGQSFKGFHDSFDSKDSGNMNDAFTKSFTNTFNNLIPPDVIKRLRIGRVIMLVRSSINILAIIPLIYGALRYKSLYILIGFIYWCTQSVIGW